MRPTMTARLPRWLEIILATIAATGCHSAALANPFAQYEANQAMQQGIALIQEWRGEEGLPHLYKALEIYRRIDDVDSGAQALYWIGSTHFGLRQYDEATQALTEAVEAAQRAGNPYVLGPSHVYLGNSLWAQGQRSLAELATTAR